MAFDNKNMISTKCMKMSCRHGKSEAWPQVLVNLQLLYAELKDFTDTILTAQRYIYCCADYPGVE